MAINENDISGSLLNVKSFANHDFNFYTDMNMLKTII